MSLFLDLATLGEQLAATKKKLEHSALIGAYLKQIAPEEIAPASRLLIGRIFPESDPRIVNISGAALNRVLVQVVGAEIEWSGSAVDFGDAVAQWLTARKWKPQGEPLQILDVYHAYEEIAQATGSGSRTRKDELLAALFQRASVVEAKYITKQVSGEMRVGVSEGSLLDALARNTGIPATSIRRANQLAGDVGAVAFAAITHGEKGLQKLALQIGRPLKPMLAQSAETVADALEQISPPIAFEYKLDGARLQIHKRDDDVKLFSRHLSDITASLPEVAEQARREIRAHDAILEGEVIAIDANGRTRPFQILMRRVGRERDVETVQQEIPVKLFLFDCLYRDGESLLDAPNTTRWNELEKIAGNIPRVPRRVIETVDDGEKFLRDARAQGHEGVMAKNLQSPYTPGERGKQWLKLKPVHTLDLIIVASEWGYGRRHGWLSNQHLAARDETTGEFLEVGKTFKGLTDQEMKTLTPRLLELKTHQTRGTVYVQPKIVVEVAFNNVQQSPTYKSGVALRHARIVAFRPDKAPADIETVQTLRALMEREGA
ncbi:MAG: ATP-dependent DNA ligase [Chloroflexota bacterium]|nr:MAG: ATP-dependent DNA ligase [Chloroflexota bacterium]